MDRVEIHHDRANAASGRVPAKLGYRRAGTCPARFELSPGDSGISVLRRPTR